MYKLGEGMHSVLASTPRVRRIGCTMCAFSQACTDYHGCVQQLCTPLQINADVHSNGFVPLYGLARRCAAMALYPVTD